MAFSGGERRIAMILKTLRAAVVAVAVAAFIVPIAAADKPLTVPLPFPDASGQYCEDFQVLIHATENRGKAHIFSSGAVVLTGTLKVEVTNLETGKTIALNISGPGKVSSDGTVLSGGGPWLFFGEAGFFGPGSPPELSTNQGRIAISLVDGSFITRLGHRVDLCPVLAS
jgi:hypothetical protein